MTENLPDAVKPVRKLLHQFGTFRPERKDRKADLSRRDPRAVAGLGLLLFFPDHRRRGTIAHNGHLHGPDLFFFPSEHDAGNRMEDLLAVPPEREGHAGHEPLFAERDRKAVRLHGLHLALHLREVGHDLRRQLINRAKLLGAQRPVCGKRR